MTATVKRKFYFFDVIGDGFEFVLDDVNSLWENESYVSTIPWERDTKLLFWEEQENIPWLFFGAFCMARWLDIPQKIKKWESTLRDIGLGKEEGIAEITYILYDPNLRILMVEYNHYWPRITAIQKHINHFIQHKPWFERYHPFSFRVRIDSSILDQLNNLDGIKLFQCKVNAIESQSVWKFDPSLKVAINSAKNLGDAETIEIILRAAKGQQISYNQTGWLLSNITKFFSSKTKNSNLNITDVFHSLKIKGITEGEVSEIDLLQNIIKFESKILKMWSSKSVDRGDILKKMKEWLNKNKDLFI